MATYYINEILNNLSYPKGMTIEEKDELLNRQIDNKLLPSRTQVEISKLKVRGNGYSKLNYFYALPRLHSQIWPLNFDFQK